MEKMGRKSISVRFVAEKVEWITAILFIAGWIWNEITRVRFFSEVH
jgi:hypothetical protein